MPTEIESRVLKLLSAIEIKPDAAQLIESWGNEAVTVACDAAMGSFPGLRPKVRNNAAALVGRMTAPQAKETLTILIRDANPEVAIRAIRASAVKKDPSTIPSLAQLLNSSTSGAVVAAEAVKALKAIGTSEAKSILSAYDSADPVAIPHRGSKVVITAMQSNT